MRLQDLIDRLLEIQNDYKDSDTMTVEIMQESKTKVDTEDMNFVGLTGEMITQLRARYDAMFNTIQVQSYVRDIAVSRGNNKVIIIGKELD